jgi:hypothetical protein
MHDGPAESPGRFVGAHLWYTTSVIRTTTISGRFVIAVMYPGERDESN